MIDNELAQLNKKPDKVIESPPSPVQGDLL